jgi:YggT family protein
VALDIVCNALNIYLICILGRILLSWFPLDPNGAMATVAGLLYTITDPVLGPLRRAVPPVRIGAAALDLSPIIVIIGIQVVQRGILGC